MENADEQYNVEDLMGSGSDCRDALHTLYSFLDGELTDERRHAIQRHLDHCGPCLQAFDWEAELKMVVAHCCRDQVPESVRERIAKALADASKSDSRNV
jgi:mycothiol system anti-sigma-R factor